MKNEITYVRKGDYLYPNLTINPTDPRPIGKYGLLRKTYLKEHKPDWYQSLLLTGKLDTYLADIEEAAQARYERIVDQLLKADPAPDKKADQMGWVRHMNTLGTQADEIVVNELIYS